MPVVRIACLSLLLCVACVEPYSPPVDIGELNALVVDGYIDAGGNALVKLSRSLPLYSYADAPGESGATVTIRASDGEVFSLSETGPSSYTTSGLDVNSKTTYSLNIRTSKGKEYVSDDVTIHPTPTIARVYYGFSATGDDVEIKTDTRDVSPEATGYYMWESVETYEYQSTYFSRFKRIDGLPVLRKKGEFVDTCWREQHLPMVLTTTKNLNDNLIFGKVLVKIPKLSPKISMRYSILVRQRAISEQEFNYRTQLAKTSNQQGSLFAEIPGPVVSNVHSTDNPGEYVLGYFRGQDIKERRFFIDNLELPLEFQAPQPPGDNCDLEASCPVGAPPRGPNTCVDIQLLSDNKIIISSVEFRNEVIYLFTPSECGDCRIKGGTTVRPWFW